MTRRPGAARWRRPGQESLHAPHRRADGRFFNPWQPRERAWHDFVYWLLAKNSLGEQALNPPPTPRTPNDGAYISDPAAPPAVTWVGHASFVAQLGGAPVITDPFFGPQAGPVSRQTPPAFGPEKLPAGTVALISHNHYDHLDQPSVAALGGRAVFLCPLGLGELLGQMGAQKVHELDWWQSLTIEGTTFTCLPAQHWSRRLGQGYNQSLWCAWLIERGRRRVFYGGDSGYFIGYREIGRRYPGIDVALLCVGAYLPRWFMHYAHQDPAEALEAARDLGAARLLPGHWGSLRLGDEPPAWLLRDLERLRPPGAPPRSPEIVTLAVGGRLPLD